MQSTYSSVPKHKKSDHGSVIELGGRVVARGINTSKYAESPTEKSCSRHAEAKAIIGARCSIEGATMYVARITKDGLRNSKPCPDCERLLREANIREVVYSVDDNRWESMLLAS